MSKKYDELDQAFDVSSTEVEVTPVEPPVDKKIERLSSQMDHIKKDYEYTRGNLYSIIEKAKKLLMVFLSWHKKVRCLEPMRLLVS